MRMLKSFGWACQRRGLLPTRWALIVSIPRQKVFLFGRESRTWLTQPVWSPDNFRLLNTFRCSTSKFGIGEKAGSNMTPRGLHRVAQKIGGGWPIGTVFKSRKPVGITWKGMPMASITTRILWLAGIEPGLNKGGMVDSFDRYIYIHGTGDEPSIGRPASHGCIQLADKDLIPLYKLIPCGTLVWISDDPRI